MTTVAKYGNLLAYQARELLVEALICRVALA